MDTLSHLAVRAGRLIALALLGALWAASPAALAGLAPSAANPRYLTYQGKPIYLVGSGFYYALSKADFDYRRYLGALADHGVNYTRAWILIPIRQRGADGADDEWRWGRGAYPVPTISPWERSGEPPAYDGQAPYHLDRFDPAYWKRLRGFLDCAQRHGIIVELTIFDDVYLRHGRWDKRPHWEYHPFNSINGGPIVADTQQGAAEFYNLDNAAVLAAQEALVGKLLAETRAFGNVIFEVCNEPYSRAISPEWLQHWVDFIHARDPRLVAGEVRGKRVLGDVAALHLGEAERVRAALLDRLAEARPLIVDETPAYRGPRHDPQGAALHRTGMWTAFVSGGHYNVLDHTWYRNPEYASDGDALRRCQSYLAKFVHRVVPWRMAPRDDLMVSAPAKAFALAEPGEAYVIYLVGTAEASQVSVALEAGRYWVRWFDPKTGRDVNRLTISVPVAGPVALASPRFEEDLVLLVRKPLPTPKGKIPEDLVPWDL